MAKKNIVVRATNKVWRTVSPKSYAEAKRKEQLRKKAEERIEAFNNRYRLNEDIRRQYDFINLFDNLPVNPKLIVAEVQHGRAVNGNVFYMLKAMSHNPDYQGYEICLFVVKEKKEEFKKFLDGYGMDDIILIENESVEYYRAMATAKYLINDTSFATFWIKKPGQVVLNTWHGTPLKAMGRNSQNDRFEIGNIQKNLIETDYLLYPNEYTAEHMTDDYMIRDIAKNEIVLSGYPRNEIFFDEKQRKIIREKYGFTQKRVYAYMPTYRGMPLGNMGVTKGDAYIIHYLDEIDRLLTDDECFYVNLHTYSKVDFDAEKIFKHIKSFPKEVETYEFLNACDVLITDYSSVFFDFAVSRRKIILFNFDEEEYLKERGMYLEMSELPFPKVVDLPQLVAEMRDTNYTADQAFLDRFCPYENAKAADQMNRLLIKGDREGLDIRPMYSNGKENVIIFAGYLGGNGITASLSNLLANIDLTKRNYYLCFYRQDAKKRPDCLDRFPKEIRHIDITLGNNFTYKEKLMYEQFMGEIISAEQFMQTFRKRYQQEWYRIFGHALFNHAIQFEGYGSVSILLFSCFEGKKTIFVHGDMVQEINTRHNQRWDILKYAYQHFDNVACVTEGMKKSVYEIAGDKVNAVTCLNLIDQKGILEGSEKPLTFGTQTEFIPSKQKVEEALRSDKYKFITVGRFSPEKAHLRLIDAFEAVAKEKKDVQLFIMGGSQYAGYFEKTKAYISEKKLTDKVFLIMDQPNPYSVLKLCDAFVLASLYEGFGLVLMEADILGKPVCCTSMPGPEAFLRANNGLIVENSTAGLIEGMEAMANGEVKPMMVDYDAYNHEAVACFEKLFD